MIVLLVELTAKPETKQDVEKTIIKIVDLARVQNNAVLYSFCQTIDDENKFILFELYKDNKAKESHLENQDVSAALGELAALLSEPPSIRVLEHITSHGLG